MKYTLYIDESGDFESKKGQWVIAGILISDTYTNCEKALTSKLSAMPKLMRLSSIKQFHLTEFRRDFGHEQAVNMAKKVLGKLNSLACNYYCVAVINHTKSSLSSREKTYRLMLADLLALCETVIPDDDVIENLDLVVASRTIDGQLQTSVSNINDEIINSLPAALEVGLATKGMVELIGKHIKIHMDYANNSWGLVCTDFLANINYHNRKSAEKQLLNSLEEQGKYTLFESLGGYRIRRASIAERDKDYVLALYRWIVITSKTGANQEFETAIRRLFSKVFSQQGTSGHIATFEALIERLWRNNNATSQYQNLSKMLSLLEQQLENFIAENQTGMHESILFRLRNMILLVENHIGNVDRSTEVSIKQNNMIDKLASNPEHFPKILDFQIHKIELLINSMCFDDALEQAENYYSLLLNYKEVWMLLTEKDDLIAFEKSRASIKAEMVLLRCKILSKRGIKTGGDTVDDDLDKFEYIYNLLTYPSDISRLNNYKVMFYLRHQQPHEAIQLCLSLHTNIVDKPLSHFDLFWLLRAFNDYNLSGKKYKQELLEQGLTYQINLVKHDDKGHPVDLLWREIAFFWLFSGNKSKALNAIKKSRNAFNLAKSPISIWLSTLIDIHEDYIKGRLAQIDTYFSGTLTQLAKQRTNKMTTLQDVRIFSPY